MNTDPAVPTSLTRRREKTDNERPSYTTATPLALVAVAMPLSEILRRAGIIIGRAPLRGKTLTSVVVVSAPDGFQAVFALAELDPVSPDNRVIVADIRDGSPLSDDEGPLRVVAPGDKYPARWIRHAIRLTVASVNSSKR